MSRHDWVRCVAVVALLVGSATVASAVASTTADAKLSGYCSPTQLRVSLSPTGVTHMGRDVTWTGSVHFANRGAACTMWRGQVPLQATSGSAHTPVGQGSMSDAVARQPFTMAPGAQAQATADVYVDASAHRGSCATTRRIDGIEVAGFQFGWPAHFFVITRPLALCVGDRVAAVSGVLNPVGPSPRATTSLGSTIGVITGSVEECGAGPAARVTRPIVVTLHRSPSGRVAARYTIEPQAGLGWYAFSAAAGRYFLTTSDAASPAPRTVVTIRPGSRSTINLPIATTCQ